MPAASLRPSAEPNEQLHCTEADSHQRRLGKGEKRVYSQFSSRKPLIVELSSSAVVASSRWREKLGRVGREAVVVEGRAVEWGIVSEIDAETV